MHCWFSDCFFEAQMPSSSGGEHWKYQKAGVVYSVGRRVIICDCFKEAGKQTKNILKHSAGNILAKHIASVRS